MDALCYDNSFQELTADEEMQINGGIEPVTIFIIGACIVAAAFALGVVYEMLLHW